MFLDKHFHKLFVLLILLSLSLVTYLWRTEAALIVCTQDCVQIGSTHINIEVADDFQKRIMGLSYRESLAPDSGMLFVMPTEQKASFWMKDMNFPLDIIWIYENKIVNIHKNIPPEGANPEKSYSSKFPVTHVLEVNAGFVEEKGIMVGDEVQINF